MLVFAAIGVFGAGMLAIAAGIPIKDFGFGNTLILSGVLAWCTSAIMITLWACFRDLKSGIEKPERRPRETEPAAAETRALSPASPAGWPESIPERVPAPPPALPPIAPTATDSRDQRRNVLFSSNRRPPPSRETPRPSEAAVQMAPPAVPPAEARPAPAEEPRPAPRRVETPPRTIRPVSTVGPRDSVSAPPLPPAPPPPAASPPPVPPAEPPAGAASPRDTERPAARTDAGGATVTVLKSGVVDGMAYWLFSDGSIEAQMPEGMMRFTSIDELRAHLDKRP